MRWRRANADALIALRTRDLNADGDPFDFASDGRLLYEEGPCSDLPASAYEVPSGVKRVRARSADDAKRLEMQLRSEERAIR